MKQIDASAVASKLAEQGQSNGTPLQGPESNQDNAKKPNVKTLMSLDGGLAKVMPKLTRMPRQGKSKHRAYASQALYKKAFTGWTLPLQCDI